MPPVTLCTYNNLHKLKIRGGTLSQNLQWQPKLQKASWQPYFACKDQTHKNRTSFHYEKVASRWHSSLLHYHRRLVSSYGDVIPIKPLPLQSFLSKASTFRICLDLNFSCTQPGVVLLSIQYLLFLNLFLKYSLSGFGSSNQSCHHWVGSKKNFYQHPSSSKPSLLLVVLSLTLVSPASTCASFNSSLESWKPNRV